MDGHVLTDIIKEEFTKKHHVQYNKTSCERNTESEGDVYSMQENSQIEKHLADLGYL